MSTIPVTRTVVIVNVEGLHARPALLISKEATKYQSRIQIICRSERVDARSALDMLTLGAMPGTELVIEAEGEDAEQAVEMLAALVASGFGEEIKENKQS
jgi:phosphocarrier protein HPr